MVDKEERVSMLTEEEIRTVLILPIQLLAQEEVEVIQQVAVTEVV